MLASLDPTLRSNIVKYILTDGQRYVSVNGTLTHNRDRAYRYKTREDAEQDRKTPGWMMMRVEEIIEIDY
jgi:hypothetical protein